MATYPIHTFPDLRTIAFEGLPKITGLKINDYDCMVQAFKDKITIKPPLQPNFFISKKTWELLANGKQENRFGEVFNWLEELNSKNKDIVNGDYEVYAFSFCVAFDNEFKRNSPQIEQYAYYRIRPILKRKKAKITGNTVPVLVARDNIAYTKISYGLGYGKSLRNDDVEFVDNKNKGLLNLIDDEVIVRRSSVVSGVNPFNFNIPDWFKVINPNLFEDILSENEGSIFGKNRIWDELLEPITTNGTTLSIAWIKNIQYIKPVFNIFNSINLENLVYASAEIDCPRAAGCPKDFQ